MNSLRFQRNIGIIVFTVLLLGGLLYFGKARIIPYIASSNGYQEDAFSIENSIGLFDDSQVHEIEVVMSNDDYDEMIQTYKEANQKDYFKVDVIIDGVLVEDVGIRLKGNLTLNTALGTMDNMGMNMGVGEGKEGMGMQNRQVPNINFNAEEMNLPTGFVPGEGQDNALMFGEGAMSEFGGGQIPYLIVFDAFVDDQTYQGISEIAIRTGDDAKMSEQIVYYAYEISGQVAPQTSYAVLNINGETQLYSLAQNIDESFIEMNFENSGGILYRAGNFVSLEYLGEDPTLYTDSFEQKTNENEDDFTPLIDFLKFINESTDEEFYAQLGDWLDLDSFIAMMALDDLLGNSDSFTGMCSNFFLYYDKQDRQFTVLSWDANMALGSGMGGGMGRENGDVPAFLEEQGFVMPEGDINIFADDGGEGAQMGMERNGNNILKNRFFANERFSDLYDEVYSQLQEQLFSTSTLENHALYLSDIITLYNENHAIVDQDAYDVAVETIMDYLLQK